MLIHSKNKDIYKTNKKKSKINFLIIAVIFLLIIFVIYYNHSVLLSYYRYFFLSENLKFLENKVLILENEIEKEIKEGGIENFYFKTTFRKEILKKIDETLQTLNVILKTNKNRKDIYYYFINLNLIRFFVTHEFTKNNLIISLSREILPPFDIKMFSQDELKKEFDSNNFLLKKSLFYTKKYQAIEEKNKLKVPIHLMTLISEISNNNYLEPFLYKYFNTINIENENTNLIHRIIYEWLFIVLHANYGKESLIEKNISNTKSFFQFQEYEALLIKAYTSYYTRNFINLINFYYLFQNNWLDKIPDSQINSFIKKEFLRLLVEVFFIQKNYNHLEFYLKELENTANNDNDPFILQRIKIIKSKLKKTQSTN